MSISFEEIANKHPVKVKVSLIVLSLIISFILGEIMIRGLDYYKYIKKSNKIEFEQYKKIYSDERDKDYIFGHKPNIKVKLSKGFYNFTFITNSEALREIKDYNYIKKSVIFLGDSIIEGSSVENNEAMDEIFEKLTGITTLNFGLGSSNTVQEYYWLKAKYRKSYNTKLIVLGFCLNDFKQNTYLRYFDPSVGNWRIYRYLYDVPDNTKSEVIHESFGTKVKNILKKSRLIVFIYSSIQNILDDKKSFPFTYDEVSNIDKYYTEKYINKINKFAKDMDAKFVVVIFPREKQLKFNYPLKKRMQYALIEILEKNHIPYIDIYGFMKNKLQASPNIRWYHDDIHPYKEGHKAIGEYLAKKLPQIFPELHLSKP